MGSARKLLNTFIVEATGQDIWNQADNFGFLYREGGNCSLEGVLSMPTADAGGGTIATNAKTGIMYRETLLANSKFFAIVRQKDGWIMTFSRNTTGGTAVIVQALPNKNEVERFKLSNQNGLLKAWYHNGSDFVEFGTSQMTFATGSKIGFCFSMIGDTAGCFVQFVSFTAEYVNTKPTGLINKTISWKSATTITTGGGVNKPTGLINKTISIRSASDPGAGGGTTPPITPNVGHSVLSFGGKLGLFYSQTSLPTLQMKITADDIAKTITDLAWDFNPPMWNGSAMATPTRAWKINDMGDWKTTALTAISVSHLLGNPIKVTKIFYFINEFDTEKMFEQIIQVN
jgi:hypothetical protein